MLSRPLLVNHADCTFVSPTLALESDPGCPDMPSPFRHINLHCKLCLGLAAELKSVSNKVIRTEVVLRLKDLMEQWLRDLPPEYALKDPDTRWDKEYDWVVFQRRYLHLVGYMCLFDPLKPYVTRNSAKPMADVERNLRAAGVQAALGLMDVSWIFFENMVSAGAKFHYAVFCIFDTTTVLCSAFVHDEARNLPQRETVLEAIKKGLNMLEELNNVSKTTAKLCRILKNLVVNLPLSAKEKGLVCAPKRIKASSSSPASDRSKGITPPSNGLGGTPFILGTDRTGSAPAVLLPRVTQLRLPRLQQSSGTITNHQHRKTVGPVISMSHHQMESRLFHQMGSQRYRPMEFRLCLQTGCLIWPSLRHRTWALSASHTGSILQMLRST
jgi:hypothetical protein